MSHPSVDELVRSLDPAREETMDAVLAELQARELPDRITTEPRRRQRARPRPIRPRSGTTARRTGIAGLAAAVAVGAALLLTAPWAVVGPVGTARAVTFRLTGNYVIALIRNPFADAGQLRALFHRQQLDVSVQLVPVSPSLVGTVVQESDPGHGASIMPLERGTCLNGPCTVGLKIPRGFTGQAEVYLGRAARAGESYTSTAISSFAPGEALHCSGLLGARASVAAATLRQEGYRVQWRTDPANGPAAPTADRFVWEASPMAPGAVRIGLRRQPFHVTAGSGGPDNPRLVRRLDAGCSGAGQAGPLSH